MSKTTDRKEYTVPVMFRSWGTVKVVAKDKEDLIKKLNDSEFVSCMSLPTDAEYIDDSFEIDFDNLAHVGDEE